MTAQQDTGVVDSYDDSDLPHGSGSSRLTRDDSGLRSLRPVSINSPAIDATRGGGGLQSPYN